MSANNLSSVSVLKRDGVTVQPFDWKKIINAVEAAAIDAGVKIAVETTSAVVNAVIEWAKQVDSPINVESIQDQVEKGLMKEGLHEVARSYIVYRNERSKAREKRLVPDPNAVANYIHPSKYARYVRDKQRRELYSETVDRLELMHERKFAAIPDFDHEIKAVFDKYVRTKKLLPSMRSMQFGGAAIEANNCRMFNCAFSYCDRTRFFQEAMYLLLCGTGVGFSVQFDHVEKLPSLSFVDEKKVRHHTVKDTIEGWSDALGSLIDSYIKGYLVEFNYSKIRDRGLELVTSGGRAPGHVGLRKSLEKIRAILHGAQGRKLRPIECYRIMCVAADAVLSGGIRRSAMICLFSLMDGEMMAAKTGNWWEQWPEYANSNNSVMLKRDEIRKRDFKRIFANTRQWGEPGFYFTESYEYGSNPCVEIGLDSTLKVTSDDVAWLKSEFPDQKFKVGDTFTGWSFCNLTEQNAAKFESKDDFVEVAKAAAFLGTLQASYTSFPYLGWVSEAIARRDALLGVGMTGMMDSPEISLDPETQRRAAAAAVAENQRVAAIIGIRPAARVTCVKPSGTTSLELGCVGSGIHPHHSRRYIRRVIADDLEVPFQHFRSINPHMCQRMPNGKWVIEFPVEAPAGAMVKSSLRAIEFLEKVKSTQQNWVIPGTVNNTISPGLTHNVSNTVIVDPEDWDAVADYLYENRQFFTGVSLLARTGDKDFAFAPYEAVLTAQDEAKWNSLIADYRPVDYSQMVEQNDVTNLTGEAACAGGACAV